MDSNITMVITSCGRHDLLKRTLDSFVEYADIFPQETIIIEDSPVPRPEWLTIPQLGKITWLQNNVRIGQMGSIDRAYAEVKTDYIFHCEDDWIFLKSGFMGLSKEIIDKCPEVVTVLLRGHKIIHPVVKDPRFPFMILEPGWDRGLWGGLSLNPGLRRLCDYTRIGTFVEHTTINISNAIQESELSRVYLSLGYVVAAAEDIYIEHIGWGYPTVI